MNEYEKAWLLCGCSLIDFSSSFSHCAAYRRQRIVPRGLAARLAEPVAVARLVVEQLLPAALCGPMSDGRINKRYYWIIETMCSDITSNMVKNSLTLDQIFVFVFLLKMNEGSHVALLVL